MKRIIVTLVMLLALVGARGATAAEPAVEVVFVLDTTGSMGSLIDGAKARIWSIANQIINGSPQPDLRVGLVAYRDIGDEYVVQVTGLTDDLDEVYATLSALNAGGGGDGPEHVSRAMHSAVEDIDWSTNDGTLRIIFLVGDAPPHTDYNDGFDYRTACESAVTRDIVVNTIQCGANTATTRFWSEIAGLGEGDYAAIPQDGGVVAIRTPMDADLAELSRELDATVVAYGDAAELSKRQHRMELADAMAPAAAAERAAFKSTSGRADALDLIDAIESGEVKLEDLDSDKLPDEIRGMTGEERVAYLERKKKERGRISRRIDELTAEREAFIKAKRSELGTADGFDEQVLSMLRTQAAKKGLRY